MSRGILKREQEKRGKIQKGRKRKDKEIEV
jgi:hypothetical protein